MTTRQEYYKKWVRDNPEKVKAAQDRYKAKHPDKVKATRKAWRNKNRDKFNAARRKWRALNREKASAQTRAWFAKERETKAGHVNRMLRLARRSGKDFDITLQDILAVWPDDDRCPVFGCPFAYGVSARENKNTPSLDRINSNRGYIKGNIAVMSWRANELKRAHSADDICTLADWLRKVKGNANDHLQ